MRQSERIRAMTTLQMTRLGVVVEIRKRTEEVIEFDVIGRARAELVRDFGATGRAAQPSPRVQRGLLRLLTPLLRPALRWNHAWAIARAVEGLEPYARARAATRVTA